MIDEAVSKLTEEQRAALNTGATSYDWFSRRIRNQRIKNRTVSYLVYMQRLTPLICCTIRVPRRGKPVGEQNKVEFDSG